MYKSRITLFFILLISFSASSQSTGWTDVSEPRLEEQLISVNTFRTVSVNFELLKNQLSQAPNLRNTPVAASDFTFEIPTPEGGSLTMKIVESSIMAPELQARYPEIRTFTGEGTGAYRNASIRIDYTLKGFHAQVLLPGKSFYIDPFSDQDLNTYIVYTREAFFETSTKRMPECTTEGENLVNPPSPSINQSNQGELSGTDVPFLANITTNGTQLRTYRLALACTGEYAQFQGGTVPLVMSAMTTSMNRVNGVFLQDVSLQMIMVSNNDDLIYLNGATDPYTNNNGGSMLSQNQTTCNSVIGSANYDIGHVFSTGGGGVAYLGSVCGSSKAGGVTGGPSPVGDPFDIDYVAHEMGHQWGANHTFNNSCGGNRTASSAYEPGSGTTIMGYAGICPPDLQPHSDAYFHNRSYSQMVNFSVNGSGNSCAVITSTGNTPPTITVPEGGFTIPISTPFELTASASDANDNPLTYCWEEYDLGPATSGSDDDLTNPSGNAPIFRSWNPTTSSTRVFPRLSSIVNNYSTIGELLPTYSRNLTFRCTVRDNAVNGGGVTDGEVAFQATSTSGPFIVTSPNTSLNWTGNSAHAITWNVANTTAAPVSCSNVDIFLSVDGGYTYPYTLLSSTPNDGSATVIIPNVPTTIARVKVKASDNIFFDISNQDFTIQAGSSYQYDVAFSGVVEPYGDICGSEITPQISFTNLGSNTLTSLHILYNLNGGSNSIFNWTGSLNAGQTSTISLPVLAVSPGPKTLNILLQNPNGNTDQSTANNSGSQSFNVIQLVGETLPVTNSFEGSFPGTGWSTDNPDNNITWSSYSVSNDVNCNSSTTARINFYAYDSDGQTDDLISPLLDLNEATAPELSFDYSYARYGSTYFDRMQVQVLVGCSSEWLTVWDKENLELTTAGSVSSSYVPACGDWASESIDLSAYTGNVIQIRFRGLTGFGNNLYLDNIGVLETAILDCYGVPNGPAMPGSPCVLNGNDGTIDNDCNCIVTNNPPVAQNDSYTTGFNETLTVNAANGLLSNDSDLDVDPIFVTIVTAESLGSLNVSADGSFTYTPNDGASGLETVEYTISDGYAIATATLTITIEANQPPIAVDDSYSTGFNEALTVNVANGLLANDSDPEGDPIAVTIVTAESLGSLNVSADGSFTYTPNDGASGLETVEYTISDGYAIATATLTITIEANQPPIAVDDSYSTGFNEALTVNVANGLLANDSDPEGDPIAVTIVTAESLGSLNVSADGSFTYTPNDGASGLETVEYTISDGYAIATATLTITIEANQPPIAVDDSYSTGFNEALTVNVANGLLANDSDPEGDPIAVTIVTAESLGSLNVSADGSFTYTPNDGASGLETVEYTISDGYAIATATLTITIEANQPPIAVDDSYSTGFNEALTVNVANGLLANDSDPEGDPIAVTIVTAESLGSLNVSADGSFTYTPNDGVSGVETVEYTISDGYNIATASLSITIQPMIDCEGVVNGTSIPGSLCDNDGVPGIYGSDCNCDPIPVTSFDGNVSWNGACGERNIQISLYNQDFPTLNYVFNTSMDAAGNFSTPEFPSGTYNVLIKVEGYLAKLYPNESINAASIPLSVTGIISGDISGDNAVTLIDISSMSLYFGSVLGDPHYNHLGDFNCDGAINIFDISTLVGSYGLAGDVNE